jgi:hypothetical protein
MNTGHCKKQGPSRRDFSREILDEKIGNIARGDSTVGRAPLLKLAIPVKFQIQIGK